MRIWMVAQLSYEPFDIIGVYTTEELAERVKAQVQQDSRTEYERRKAERPDIAWNKEDWWSQHIDIYDYEVYADDQVIPESV